MLRLGPLHLPWSLLLGGLLFFPPRPKPLVLLRYAAVLPVPAAGHAFALPGTKVRVTAVMLHGLGGELLGDGETTPLRKSAIALSGVVAQLALLLTALIVAMPSDLHDA